MADEKLVLTLAKVLIAVGWSDGELTHDEINSMKDLLFHLPELSAAQWAVLQMYIEAPVDDAERARLIAELRDAVGSQANKQLVHTAIAELVAADGLANGDEAAAVEEITAALESTDAGIAGKLTAFVRGLTAKRAVAMADAPNREQFFDDNVRNKVYYNVRQRANHGAPALDLPDDVLRKLCLAGGMMAQVARVNPQITAGESTRMVEALQAHWSLNAEQAAFVAAVAVSDASVGLDRFRLAREFAETCSLEESRRFVDVLFSVATADGEASYDEIEEIRLIAFSLKLTHREFIDAKLRIPRAQRQQ